MHFFIVVVLISLSISWFDITARRIPNTALNALLVTGILFLLRIESSGGVNGGIIFPIIVFIIGYVLSMANIIGMGDVKLITIALMLTPAKAQADMLYFTTFFGGIWGGLWHLILRHIPFVKKIDKVQAGIPYGIPIVLAMCLFTFVQ